MSNSTLHAHILRALPSGVIILDGKGRVAEANPVAYAMLGEPLTHELWLNVINRCFQPRGDDGLEVSLKDGRRVNIAISTIEPHAGQLIVLTDLTETRQLQQRLHHHQRLSTLGKMMATLAHQIRTPLASALLYAENLQSSKLAVSQRQQFQQKLVLRLRELEQQVNDMLLFARSGTAQAVKPVFVSRLCHNLQDRSDMLLAQHQATLEFAGLSTDYQLIGNESSLTEALLNLLQNSLQAAGQGAQLQLYCRRESQHSITLLFSDNGPGLTEQALTHLFEPFFTTKPGGSGLGLAVVQAVIHSHQGQIRYVPLAQRPPKVLAGACFAITLPLAQLPVTGSNRAEEMAHV